MIGLLTRRNSMGEAKRISRISRIGIKSVMSKEKGAI
jgi:hypothetical protein